MYSFFFLDILQWRQWDFWSSTYSPTGQWPKERPWSESSPCVTKSEYHVNEWGIKRGSCLQFAICKPTSEFCFRFTDAKALLGVKLLVIFSFLWIHMTFHNHLDQFALLWTFRACRLIIKHQMMDSDAPLRGSLWLCFPILKKVIMSVYVFVCVFDYSV